MRKQSVSLLTKPFPIRIDKGGSACSARNFNSFIVATTVNDKNLISKVRAFNASADATRLVFSEYSDTERHFDTSRPILLRVVTRRNLSDGEDCDGGLALQESWQAGVQISWHATTQEATKSLTQSP